MPSPAIPKTVADCIYYYYAKLVVAPSAGLKSNYGFIIDTYKKLKRGQLQLYNYERELELLSKSGCLFCNQQISTFKKLIPLDHGHFIGRHNLVPICKECNSSWGSYDVVTWWCEVKKEPKESIPRPIIGSFLKMIFEYHHINFSLNKQCSSLLDLAKSLSEI